MGSDPKEASTRCSQGTLRAVLLGGEKWLVQGRHHAQQLEPGVPDREEPERTGRGACWSHPALGAALG